MSMGETAEAPREQKPTPAAPEAGRAPAQEREADVVKIGDSERRTSEAARAMNIARATVTFLEDLGKANLLAKRELGELASARLGKALAVGAAGGALEYIADTALRLAMNKLLPMIPAGPTAEMKKTRDFFNSPIIKEIIEDLGVYGAYQKGNALIGDALPSVPASFLGAAVGVDVVDALLRSPQQSQLVKLEPVAGQDGFNALGMAPQTNAPGGEPAAQTTGFLRGVRRLPGVLADIANPVTLFAAAQVTEGVAAYLRAVRDIRGARKRGDAQKLAAMLKEAAKTKAAGRRGTKERALDVLEKIVSDNGK